jgi:hypothetical protein
MLLFNTFPSAVGVLFTIAQTSLFGGKVRCVGKGGRDVTPSGISKTSYYE